MLAFMQSAGREQTLAIWLHAEKPIQKVSSLGRDEDLSGITFSPDGELLGACVESQGIQLSPPRIQLWTVNPPGPRQSIPLSEGSSCGFGFTDGNRRIAYIDGEEIRTWDIAAGGVTTRKRPGPPSSPDVEGFDRFLTSFAVAPDGRTAIYEGPYYGGPYGVLSWWDLDRQEPLPGMEISSPSSPASISFTPDSRLAVLDMGGAVLLVDVARRMPLAVYSTGPSYGSGALSRDGRLIAASGGGSVITLTETGDHNGVPAYDHKGVLGYNATHVAVQPDGKHLTTKKKLG
jgi:WD40 repeat protein